MMKKNDPQVFLTVNFSHPFPLCELALAFSTVKHALSNKTPCFAQPDNVP